MKEDHRFAVGDPLFLDPPQQSREALSRVCRVEYKSVTCSGDTQCVPGTHGRHGVTVTRLVDVRSDSCRRRYFKLKQPRTLGDERLDRCLGG